MVVLPAGRAGRDDSGQHYHIARRMVKRMANLGRTYWKPACLLILVAVRPLRFSLARRQKDRYFPSTATFLLVRPWFTYTGPPKVVGTAALITLRRTVNGSQNF